MRIRKGATGSDLKRLGGSMMLLLGRIQFVLALLYSGTSAAFGLPPAQTPVRAILFLAIGAGLSFGGYRIASGTWSGSTRLLHWSAAAAGVLFIVSLFSLYFFGGRAVLEANLRSTVICLAISVLALLSWILGSRR